MLVYAITIFISAFLLFQVQPMIAKIILPWFGGGAAVWSTCMMFFQIVLLLGYLYSHATTRYMKPKAQAILHSVLLLISLALLIILIQLPGSSDWKPIDEKTPLLRILVLLGATIGLPYLMLSTTGPLIQAWYVRATSGAVPYRLFALSNFGSFLALLSFPFVVEPLLASKQQVYAWGAGFAVFALLTIYTGWRTLKVSGDAEAVEAAHELERLPSIPWGSQLLWIALSATASVMLLAITSQLTQNVAPIPFLWVLPLSIYLLTFILCFESSRYYKREIFLPLLALALGLAGALLMEENRSGFWPIYAWAAILFVCCMVCHGELALQKPNPKQLTLFFLMVSVGGAIGGSFVAILAPLVFDSYWELPISLVCCGALAAWIFWKQEVPKGEFLPDSWRTYMVGALGVAFIGLLFFYRHESDDIWTRQAPLVVPAGIAFALLAVLTLAYGINLLPKAVKLDWIAIGFGIVCVVLLVRDIAMRAGYLLPQVIEDADSDELGFGFLAALAAMAALAGLLTITGTDIGLSSKRLGVVFALLAIVLGGHLLKYQLVSLRRFDSTDQYRLITRNFYGVLKVRDEKGTKTSPPDRVLVHGTINHGVQLLDDKRRDEITSYYNPKSGFGRMMQIEQRKGPIKVGITGLGAGVTAGFCRAGDTFRFYELNPLVLDIANTWFTFLKDCKADKQVYLGDGRLNLERQASQQFDVLAMDAFSSDSVPVHLLTKEVFALYARHLKPDGVLAINVSNRYLNLVPIVTGNAKANGMSVVLVEDEGKGEEFYAATSWMLCSRNPAQFDDPLFNTEDPTTHEKDTQRPKEDPKIRPWTDDYSNLFQILKKRGE
jgi:hypothetical protein